MTTPWHPSADVTPTPNEIEYMAATLEARHGCLAAQVADFFSSSHTLDGDAGRSWAWAGVAKLVRLREHQRLRGAAAGQNSNRVGQ
ncbi:MAG: hypothetical protein AAGG72_03705 [Pseudomonadota bacterium]